jgi:tetratricopeptide (TPR) repeat protein
LGYCYEEKGDYEKALDYFKRSLNEDNCAIEKLLYLNIAGCYEALNDNASALEYYKKTGGDESNSPFFTLARDKVAALKN